MLKKIECYIQPFKLEAIKDALIKAGVEGMSVSKVEGFGKQRGYQDHETPSSHIKFLPKTKLGIVINENIVEDVASKSNKIPDSMVTKIPELMSKKYHTFFPLPFLTSLVL